MAVIEGRRRLGATLVALALVLAPNVALADGYASSSTVARFLGGSAQERPILAECRGGGDRTVLLVGGMHAGAEAITSRLAYEVLSAVRSGELGVPDGVRLCVLPVLNPDGVALGRRTNARDVDLNRNWPTGDWGPWAYHPNAGTVSGGSEPLSEPETRALYHYIVETGPSVVIVLHCCGGLVEANEQDGAAEIGTTYAATAGFAYTEEWTLYPISGQFIDAMEGLGVPAIDVEMSRPDDTAYAMHLAAVGAILTHVARADE